MNMQKMRWFIIGNLIGFAILFCGIAAKEKAKYGGEKTSAATSDASPATPADASSSVTAPAGDQSKPAAEPSQSADEANSADGLVTARDITKGTILHAGDVDLRKIDRKHIKAGGFSEVESALGRKTKVDLVEGEVLQTSDLESK
jgi:flagella basal body P-ring formation protein FlgA